MDFSVQWVYTLMVAFWTISGQVEAILKSCQRHTLKLNDVLTVQFPGDGSEQYTGGADDCLVVKAAELTDMETRVKLQVQYFDVEHHYSCQKDYLEIRDGRSENSRLIARWCGVKTDETVESSGRYIFLRIVTDNETFATGFKLHVSTTTDSAKEEGTSEGPDVILFVPICIGIVIFLVSIIVICIVFFVIPRRKKRQRAAAERQGRENPAYQHGAVEMVHVGGPVGGKAAAEPIKPPSYTCAVRESNPRPEIPAVSTVVPSAPPPTYTFAVRDPPNRPPMMLYPQLDTNTS